MLYRRVADGLELLLAHPGGPFWKSKDAGAWTIPKGLVEPDEDLLEAARREFREETGAAVQGPFIALRSIRQKAGKIVHAWACEGEFDVRTAISNTMLIEWPPGSGRKAEFPEIDRCEWFRPGVARTKLIPAQVPFIDRLEEALAGPARA
jgi:predicted NUDIX family NTP pyrophosphohydrolase